MNNKLGFSAGVLNIVLGSVLFVDAILIALMAFCCLIMSFTMFFMAAIPAFLFTGFLFFVALAAAIANIVTGTGAVVTSVKGGTVSKIFSVVSTVVDIAVIPANIVALVCGTYLLFTEISWLSVMIFIIAACAIILAVISLILNLICLMRTKKSVDGNTVDV